MSLLSTIDSPQDVKRLDHEELVTLAAEIRDFLIHAVARTGGHLGPNLGAVELTLAIHRVFDSPFDRVLWDTGHQSYVHKILTGRREQFDRLRQRGGLSGYPSQAESEHDIIENSHASTALSYADGLSRAYELRGENRAVVAVVGDGALTGGMCWEALNNIAASDRQVVIVVNDNGRSYSPTIGGLADHLASLRLAPEYEQVLDVVKQVLGRTPLVGAPLFDALHGIKKGIKDVVTPQGMFEDLGLKYVGPVDGHDVVAMESALRRAKDFGGPVIVHAMTRKGFGYPAAEQDDADNFHAVGVIDPLTGKPKSAAKGATWTSIFSEEIVRIGSERPDVVTMTAAMLQPVGLKSFAKAFPDRVFDVGIAEQHAVTSAAGLAMGGLKPVVCIYATFLNRAFDQVLMDVAMHRQPVTFVLDRAGITGEDGASHNGMWDMSFLQVVPGLAIAAPRDAATLRAELDEAVSNTDGPTVVRYPKGKVAADSPAIDQVGGVDVLYRAPAAARHREVLLVSIGAMAPTCLDVAERVASQGIGITVVDPRWVKPLDPALVDLARDHDLVVTVEDNGRVGGVGACVAQLLRDADVDVPVREFGVAQRFLDHGKRDDVLAEVGLAPQDLARKVIEAVAKRQHALMGDEVGADESNQTPAGGGQA
ncbi:MULTISPECIES: 1-deoxy-D-xylulose-5-phosphate synthase [unclassified Parafrankia]|uniref:1-deoxy-D-xylulose-5-phosphate synthase n=1 Tax=unclassified Parafrankia TaxID=2994368 RepID=UPI000DA4D1A5|nr:MULTISPECIES: 1-deoxy-D-xylulose-5-phosphate synthase [unclassified Parafrankia]TCJ36159.1 1-deoxy-D-xylulose-5-phosphate synthase [Parafrankia sp. BMG5.11]CAI7977859.1 1-deoxy-D-xylulose-5-phosphate synthase [Frankia sp. Hr75.2]SQD98807.1 1-deoxy-D-xylulose-5-phosphate synthase [Parafrankia sp. Ea1.12]